MSGRENAQAGAHGGLRHWTYQRASSILLVPLTLWLLWAATQLTGADFNAARAFLSTSFHTVMAALTAATLLYHAQSGIQVVCEDYVQPAWLQAAMIGLARLSCAIGFLASIIALYAIGQGS